MTLLLPFDDRPLPIDRWGCAPGPDGDELQADADTAWAIALGLIDDSADEASDATGSDDASGTEPSVLEGLLHQLEAASGARHRATADEYRLIARVLADARDDPTPWTGPDPTLDPAWADPRGRTTAAVRRDRLDMTQRAAVAEIAVRLHLSESTVRSRAAHAEVLQQRCPAVFHAFSSGCTSERHAVEAARLAASLPDDDPSSWRLFDEGVTPRATDLVPATFATAARAVRERVHAESLESRHRRAARDRGVWLAPELDGMASLTAFLPAEAAQRAIAQLDQIARRLRAAPDEARTLAQVCADVLADLITAPPADAQAVASASTDASASSAASCRRPSSPMRPAARTAVVVTIPALTLLGAAAAPATLDGYGPIDLDTARRLAGAATSWVRVLAHPVSGTPLVLDRSTSRVPAALRGWLGVTSPTCVFPRCRRSTGDCDVEHLRAGAGADPRTPRISHPHAVTTTGCATRRPGVPHDPTTGGLVWTSPISREVAADPPPF